MGNMTILYSMKKYICLILLGDFSGYISVGQIRVTPTNIDDWVKKNFSGQGVVIGNVKHTGSQQAIASFTSTANVLQVQKGMILSTGYASGVSGVNNQYNRTKAFVDMRTPQRDPDIEKLISYPLYDICIIEFDFVPMANSLQFNYQFGSDEYPEWVNSGYNDIFAFYVSDETSSRNIALVPGTSVPVSINTINDKTNSNYFIDNNVFKLVTIKGNARIVPKATYKRSFTGRIWHGIKKIFSSGPDPTFDRQVVRADAELLKKVNPALYRNLQYDGITTKLVAQAYVEPYKKYHLKLIITDVSDNLYDSGVFIEDHSLTAKRDTLQPGFVDFPDYSKVINPQLILEGKKLADILPPATANVKPTPATGQITVTKAEEEKLAAENVTVYFDIDKTVINPPEMEKLKKMAEIYGKLKDKYNIRISGHTDNTGSLDYNFDLSKRRDQAVIDSLRKLITGTTFNVLSVTEKAYLQPAADNSTDQGRTLNRRVEIVFIKKDER
jgi:outer membrane protein OmpA-like peptidoglycan-associated protein